MINNLLNEVIAYYPLDALNDGYVPPVKAGELVRRLKIDKSERANVRVERLSSGESFLRWEEPPDEEPGEDEVLSFIDREEQLTRGEAFALVAAACFPSNFYSGGEVFDAELTALWPSA
jgi:hypothetical protein